MLKLSFPRRRESREEKGPDSTSGGRNDIAKSVGGLMRKEYLKLLKMPLLFLLLLLFPVYLVHAEDSNQTLKQHISDLQKSPNDNALRVKIVKLVQTMKQAPRGISKNNREGENHDADSKSLYINSARG